MLLAISRRKSCTKAVRTRIRYTADGPAQYIRNSMRVFEEGRGSSHSESRSTSIQWIKTLNMKTIPQKSISQRRKAPATEKAGTRTNLPRKQSKLKHEIEKTHPFITKLRDEPKEQNNRSQTRKDSIHEKLLFGGLYNGRFNTKKIWKKGAASVTEKALRATARKMRLRRTLFLF